MSDKVNILLCDDDPGILMSLEATLESLKQNIFKAQSAREALKLLLAHDFAAILLDVRMPEMDGFEAARLIRGRQRSAKTPIIFLTGMDEGRFPLFHAYELGAVDYLVKPFEPTILRSKLAVFIDLAQKTEQVRKQAEALREQERQEYARVLAEQQMQTALAQQRWLEAILDAMPTPLLLLDPTDPQPMRFANRAARSLAGGAFIQKTPPAGFEVHDSGGPLTWEHLPLVRAARGERLDGAMFMVDKPEPLAVVAYSEKLPAQHGNKETVLLCLLDVTALKQTEENLKEALQAREDFLAVGSHELRTPITALKFQVRNALKSWERPETIANPASTAISYLTQVQGSVDRLARLSEYLLDVSRLGARQVLLKRESVDLKELVQSAAQRTAQEPGVPESVVRVEATGDTSGHWDKARMEQIVTNLVDNARKYAPGKIEVVLRGEADRVTLTVSDHGPGIPASELPKLFKRFSRARTVDDGRGFGLGLWIVAQLVAHHGGTVHVESKPGHGARFTVTLPRMPEQTVPVEVSKLHPSQSV